MREALRSINTVYHYYLSTAFTHFHSLQILPCEFCGEARNEELDEAVNEVSEAMKERDAEALNEVGKAMNGVGDEAINEGNGEALNEVSEAMKEGGGEAMNEELDYALNEINEALNEVSEAINEELDEASSEVPEAMNEGGGEAMNEGDGEAMTEEHGEAVNEVSEAMSEGGGEAMYERADQMNLAPESGKSYPRRPFTRSQTKLCAEKAAQLNLIFDGKVLHKGLEQITNLQVRTVLERDRNKMMIGGKSLKSSSSADTIQIESSDENLDWLPTCSEPEENDIKRRIEIKDELTSGSEGHRTLFPEINDAPRFVSKTTVVKSRIHPLDMQTTERRSQSNTENYRPKNVCLTAMDFNTSLLQTIYSKYGDITKDCNIKSEEFKKSCLLGISEVVQKLQDTKFDDLNYDDFTEMYCIIKDAERQKFDVKWLQERLVEIDDSLRSKDKLKRVEEAEGVSTVQQENLKKRVEMNKLEIAELEIEIKVLEEEQAVQRSTYDEVNTMIDDIKSLSDSFPIYGIDYLL